MSYETSSFPPRISQFKSKSRSFDESSTSGLTGGELSSLKITESETRDSSPGGLGVARAHKKVAVPGTGNRLEKALLSHSLNLLTNLVIEDEEQYAISYYAIRGTLADLWDSAIKSSERYQDLLAFVESVVQCNYVLNDGLRDVLIESVNLLLGDVITHTQLEVLRDRAAEAGHNPLNGLAGVIGDERVEDDLQ